MGPRSPYRASKASAAFPLRKKLLFSAIIAVTFLIFLDRSLKVYDTVMQKKREAKDLAVVSTMLASSQLEDYKAATDLKLYPYVMFRMSPNFHSKTINVNSMGFRGREIEKEKREGLFRIIVVGGSAAMGYGSTSDETAFPYVLERLLNAESKGARFEVINAGLAAAISRQELIVIAAELLDLRPDMIILFDGFNDIVGSVINDRRPNYPWRFETLEKAISASPTKLFINKRLRNFRPTRKILDLIEEKRKREAWRQYRPNDPAVEAYLENVRKMCALIKASSAEPVVVLQPALYFKKDISRDERSILDSQPQGLRSIVEPMFEKGRIGLGKAAKEEGVLFLDLSHGFDAHPETIFFDAVHFGDKGQEIIAEKIFQSLKSLESITKAIEK